MPKYVYKCLECNQLYEVIHSFKENINTCAQINKDSQCEVTAMLERVPQHINFLNIEKTKEEVNEHKNEMINWSPKK
jgi:hypothetical protein